MIADMGQSQGNRTKLQMQTIQQASRVSVDKSVPNVEMAVLSIEGRSDLKVFTDYAANFDKTWEEAQVLQGAQPSDG